MVACGEQYADETQMTLINPALIAEVTSESTKLYDRLTKLQAYRRMPSVQDILIVDQHQLHIEQYTRMERGWLVQEFTEPADVLALDSPGCTLVVSDVYAKVSFES